MEYRLHIEGSYTPSTIPMARLAEYVTALGQLLGEKANVHFGGVTEGSVVLCAVVEEPAAPKVRARLVGLGDGRGDRDAQRAFMTLDDLLRKDDATGRLAAPDGSVVVAFPGRTRAEPVVYGPFRQAGTLEGEVIRVGGKDATVPIHLRDGETIHTGLNATVDMAQRIARHLYGAPVRVYGVGTWVRHADGAWELKAFRVNEFEVLDDAPLTDVVARLRAVRGSGWSEVPDPVRELLEDRDGGREHH